MQINPISKKGFAIGVIILLGMNIAPLASGSLVEKDIVKEKLNPALLSDSRGINITLDGHKGWNDWYVSNVKVTITCNESNHSYYKINNDSWIENTPGSPIIITIDGYYTIYAYFVYINGTQSPIVSVSFKIDKTAPVIAQFIVKRYFFFTWKFTADVYDNMSGVNSVWIVIDNTGWNLTSPPYEVLWKGLMFLVIWKFNRIGDLLILPHCEPYDNAGNTIMLPSFAIEMK